MSLIICRVLCRTVTAERSTAADWILTETGGPCGVPLDFHAWVAEWKDIAGREQALGIPVGRPLLISPSNVDHRVNEYFRSAFRLDQNSTALTYAIELRTWFRFLKESDTYWDEADARDVRQFQIARVYPEQSEGRIQPATWNKAWAALNHFYRWAVRVGYLDVSPVSEDQRLRGPARAGGFREKNARASRDRWLAPSEYSMWRNIGLRGYGAALDSQKGVVASQQDETTRVRNIGRNTAFVDYALLTGLRLSEVGSLLSVELPSQVDVDVPIIGKGNVKRHYRVMHHLALQSLHTYQIRERRSCILRAQRSGAYDDIPGRLDVAELLSGRSGSRVRLIDGQTLDVLTMPADQRRRLFIQDTSGWQPAWLWLTETGTPMPHQSWEAVFLGANKRVSSARKALGVRNPWVHVTPHSLRFTFALLVLLASIRAIDDRLGMRPTDPFDLRAYMSAFDEVRDLLGHASVQTTREIYLEPVKGLRRAPLLRTRNFDEMWNELMGKSPLVGFTR
ncbi:tyrosine-type recombinase/integrase [Actinoplanes subtropicus]|uniref:tyrosine-type recombinase/integrase n=1 Tax=Actinoplanes subtropicus TaxID=543632 RepID=UPI0009FCF7F6|nr:site-specific integrase [Actinoplanes subtropicus]